MSPGRPARGPGRATVTRDFADSTGRELEGERSWADSVRGGSSAVPQLALRLAAESQGSESGSTLASSISCLIPSKLRSRSPSLSQAWPRHPSHGGIAQESRRPCPAAAAVPASQWLSGGSGRPGVTSRPSPRRRLRAGLVCVCVCVCGRVRVRVRARARGGGDSVHRDGSGMPEQERPRPARRARAPPPATLLTESRRPRAATAGSVKSARRPRTPVPRPGRRAVVRLGGAVHPWPGGPALASEEPRPPAPPPPHPPHAFSPPRAAPGPRPPGKAPPQGSGGCDSDSEPGPDRSLKFRVGPKPQVSAGAGLAGREAELDLRALPVPMVAVTW